MYPPHRNDHAHSLGMIQFQGFINIQIRYTIDKIHIHIVYCSFTGGYKCEFAKMKNDISLWSNSKVKNLPNLISFESLACRVVMIIHICYHWDSCYYYIFL